MAKKTCIHEKARNGYLCKECPGKGICEHNKVRSICKECGGSQICEHNKVRSICKECGVKLRNEPVGTSFGVSQLHGAIEPIYTLHEFTQ